MGRDRRTKDQKRHAKLKERSRKQPTVITPYEGVHYRQDEWIPYVMAIEEAVYFIDAEHPGQLTNPMVRGVFHDLAHALRETKREPWRSDALDEVVHRDDLQGLLATEILHNFIDVMTDVGWVTPADFVGILRMLLYSIEAQARCFGPTLGYLHFLRGFMPNVLRSAGTHVGTHDATGDVLQFLKQGITEQGVVT